MQYNCSFLYSLCHPRSCFSFYLKKKVYILLLSLNSRAQRKSTFVILTYLFYIFLQGKNDRLRRGKIVFGNNADLIQAILGCRRYFGEKYIACISSQCFLCHKSMLHDDMRGRNCFRIEPGAHWP